jgi:hypothetical protein
MGTEPTEWVMPTYNVLCGPAKGYVQELTGRQERSV